MNDGVLNINGIKCDNPECSFRNDDVSIDEYEKWLNRPCPECSSNLLTEADYDAVKMMINLVKIQNEASSENSIDEPIFSVNINMDGSGNLSIDDIILDENK
jgi:hypothetical protein